MKIATERLQGAILDWAVAVFRLATARIDL